MSELEHTDTEDVHIEPIPAVHPIEEKYSKLVLAAQSLIDLYRAGHTIVTYEDYKYPGLEALAKALDGVD